MKNYTVRIPSPCGEDWNAMSKTEQGKFCQSCSKEVVDFTHFSDEEIVNYFKSHHQEKTCGRFQQKQLNKPITIQSKTSSKVPLFLLTGAALFSFHTAMTQDYRLRPWKNNIDINDTIVPLAPKEDLLLLRSSQQGFPDSVRVLQETVGDYVLRGTVVMGEEPLFGAIIQVDGTKYGAQSDFDGNFSIELPSYENVGDSLELLIDYMGQVKTFYVHKSELSQAKTFELEESAIVLEGVDVVVEKERIEELMRENVIDTEIGMGVLLEPDVLETMTTSENHFFKGTIRDSEEELLFGAIILLKGTKYGAQSDFDGNYSFQIPKDAQLPDTLTLIFDYMGETKEVVVDSLNKEVDYQFGEYPIMLGVVGLVIIETKKQRFKRRLKERFSLSTSAREERKWRKEMKKYE